MTESFASAESMFGAKTNEFMIKATTVVAGLFLVTCLSLAVFSAQKGKSLMSNKVATQTPGAPAAQVADTITDLADDIIIGGEEAEEAREHGRGPGDGVRLQGPARPGRAASQEAGLVAAELARGPREELALYPHGYMF